MIARGEAATILESLFVQFHLGGKKNAEYCHAKHKSRADPEEFATLEKSFARLIRSRSSAKVRTGLFAP